jgi:chemotaxis protein CheC
MSFEKLTDDHFDALREIMNIAMGRAGLALATIFNQRIDLKVPEIVLVAASELTERFSCEDDHATMCAAVRQAFFGQMRGEIIIFHRRDPSVSVLNLLDYDGPSTESSEREFLLEVSNMLIGALIGNMGKLMACDIGYSRPTLISLNARPVDLVRDCSAAWDKALLTTVHFELESGGFTSRVLILLPQSSEQALLGGVEAFMGSI